MAAASLRIRDGYTERVGFKGTSYRTAIEFTMRPYAGYDGAQAWSKVIDAGLRGESQTAILVDQILERASDCRIGGEPADWTPEGLRELRAPEFEALAFAIHAKLAPEYMLIPDPENPGELKEISYPSAEERAGN